MKIFAHFVQAAEHGTDKVPFSTIFYDFQSQQYAVIEYVSIKVPQCYFLQFSISTGSINEIS